MSAPDNDLVQVSPAMIRRGVEALLEEPRSTPNDELVDLIYTAMEYQRRREFASSSTPAR